MFYLTQDAPTEREARTGIDSGEVVVVLPAGTHLPQYSDRWVSAARTRAMVIGERSGVGGHTLRSAGRAPITLADGSLYEMHRVAVERALPEGAPVIRETDLQADATYWVERLIERVESKAARELRYGSPEPIVRDVRFAVREVTPTEAVDDVRVTRTVTATGQVTVYSGDSLDDLAVHIIAPLVQEERDGRAIDPIAPGLGRPLDVNVELVPMGESPGVV
ncbi:hypothetical protein [Blastococcus sp. TF02A-26]|uniref:hypothetical protein n=1 Tax=Blastococcus sp. TF02A-26 TaxID=2250577 RepID=UPI0011BFE136|nr:hypothetical protein [Blastococcus sp. TF02A-26]